LVVLYGQFMMHGQRNIKLIYFAFTGLNIKTTPYYAPYLFSEKVGLNLKKERKICTSLRNNAIDSCQLKVDEPKMKGLELSSLMNWQGALKK